MRYTKCESSQYKWIKATYKRHRDSQRHCDTQLPQMSLPIRSQNHIEISKMVRRYHGNEACQPTFSYSDRHRNIMRTFLGIQAKSAKSRSRDERSRSRSNVDRCDMAIELELKVG